MKQPSVGLDADTKKMLGAARTLGTGSDKITLSNDEILRICARIALDMGHDELAKTVIGKENIPPSYFETPLEWFKGATTSEDSFTSQFEVFRGTLPSFVSYFKCLCELHKRRAKFNTILQAQGFAKVEQIVPRVLLEYGSASVEAISSWLIWRKWFYDIDNRSAQETGYLFEPILAAALGGNAYGAKNSPIKRSDDDSKGRQVDCIVIEPDTEECFAYEFKLRVTIAASGQGRFSEEIAFAEDCHNSGCTPILIVLDPTDSTRLVEYVEAFEKHGGKAYVGDNAWAHLEEKSGDVMSLFLENYVRRPLNDARAAKIDLSGVSLESDGTSITINIGGESIKINRIGPKIPSSEDVLDLTDTTGTMLSE